MGSEPRTDLPTRQVIFFRKEGWYPVVIYGDEDIPEHVDLNPGTLRVEDVAGNVLWRPQ